LEEKQLPCLRPQRAYDSVVVSDHALPHAPSAWAVGADSLLISPLLPELQAQFHVPTERAGWMVGAYTLGAAGFALIAGPL
jgi:predicted MFS family arabinose efflux permease